MAYLDFFGIENFRIFKEKTLLDLKKISILIGANSVGKSSLNKGLLLFFNSLINSKLEFEQIENKLQLGGAENSFSWNSKSEDISFTLPFEVQNYPILGKNGFLQCIITISKDDVLNRKFFFNEDLIIELDDTKITFNLHLFFKHLDLSKEYEIVNISDLMPSDSKFREKLWYKRHCKFGIVLRDKKQYFKSYGINNKTTSNFLPHTVLYSSDKEEDLFQIVSFYRTKIDFENSKTLNFYIEQSEEDYKNMDPGQLYGYPTPWAANPLKEFFKKFQFSDLLINFINETIFGNYFINDDFVEISPSKNKKRFNEFLLDIINNTEYHRGLMERSKRIYQYGEESELNDILKSFRNNKSRNSADFVKKWSGESGFGFLGDLILEDNTKYAFRSISIGLSSLANEGQGISQLVSLMLNISSTKNKIFLIEEPENFLHPSYQSKLADFFIDAQETFGHQFIIETHSEYLIRKLQYLVAKKDFKAEDAVIYNFRKATDDNPEIVKRIDIDEDGGLSTGFYPGFFDEALSWELELLKLKRSKSSLN